MSTTFKEICMFNSSGYLIAAVEKLMFEHLWLVTGSTECKEEQSTGEEVVFAEKRSEDLFTVLCTVMQRDAWIM